MWQIEQERYVGGKTRWQPVKGERYGRQEDAEQARRTLVRRALRDAAGSNLPRTSRFRIVPVVETCAVMQ
jgi:hypothetical protein